jgi:hypothetical protein
MTCNCNCHTDWWEKAGGKKHADCNECTLELFKEAQEINTAKGEIAYVVCDEDDGYPD